MKKQLIGECPICRSNLYATELTCRECNTRINGEFALSKFDYLTEAQQNFVLVFLKNAGNIKMVEKELEISYPTVKKNLEEVIAAMGFDKVEIRAEGEFSREEILHRLKRGEIDFDIAEKLLKEAK